MTSRDKAIYRAALEQERRERAADLERRKAEGKVKSPSANRKRRKHGRPR